MPRITRICLDRIGVNHSHFVETFLECRHPGNDEPITTVVLAENGTGKTQGLRLILNTIVPTAARKMKVEIEGRPYWDSAVFEKEAGLVLLEWAPDVSTPKGLFESSFRERFVTGMIAFHKGEGVIRHFFSLVTRENEPTSTFEGLFEFLAGKAMGKRPTGDEMLKLLDMLKKSPALSLFETTSQKEWESHEAKDLGIDIKAFEMQVPLNLQEATTGGSLIFKDERQFVDYVVELLVPGVNGWEDPLKRIRGLADQVKRENEEVRPALEGLGNALGPVVDLGINLNQRILASRRMTSLFESVTTVCSAIETRRNLKQSEMDTLKMTRDGKDADRQKAVRHLTELKANCESLEAWIGRTKMGDLHAQAGRDEDALKRIERERKVSQAVPFWVDREDCKAELQAVQQALVDLDRDESGLSLEIRELANASMAGWLGVQETLKKALQLATDQLATAESDFKANRKNLGEIQGQIGTLDERIRATFHRVKEVENSGLDLVAEGVLKAGEEPEKALERIREAIREQQDGLSELRRHEAQNAETIDSVRNETLDCRAEQDGVASRIRAAKEDIQAWSKAMIPLVLDKWLARLAEQNVVDDEDDLGQLEQAMRILPSLMERGGHIHAQLLAKHTEVRDRYRDLEKEVRRMEIHGTMPSTEDSDAVVQVLRKNLNNGGIWAAPTYLSQIGDESVALRALRMLPGLDGGVVVKDELLGGIDLTTFGGDMFLERTVGVFRESMVRNPQVAETNPFAVVGMGGRWWFNVEAFNIEVLKRKRELDELLTAMRQLHDDAENLSTFLASAKNINGRWEGRIEGKRGSLVALEEKLNELALVLEEYEARMKRLQDEKTRLRQAIGECEAAATKLPRQLGRLEGYLREVAKIQGWLSAREKDEALRKEAEGKRSDMNSAAEEIQKRIHETRRVCDGIRSDLLGPEQTILQLQRHAEEGIFPVHVEQSVLERDTKVLFAKVEVFDGLTRDRKPERDRYLSELGIHREHAAKCSQHLEAFFRIGILEDEIRVRRDEERSAQASGSISVESRLENEAGRLEKAIQDERIEAGKIEAVLVSKGILDRPEPEPVPEDVDAAVALLVDLEVFRKAAGSDLDRLVREIDESNRKLEVLNTALSELQRGFGVVDKVATRAREKRKTFTEGLDDLEWVDVPAERLPECERGFGHLNEGEWGEISLVLSDAGVHENLFRVGNLQSWVTKAETLLEGLEKAFGLLRKRRGQCEAAARNELDRPVFREFGTYFQLRQLFQAPAGKDSATVLDQNLAHITQMVRGHIEALELEIRRFRDSKALSINFLETIANLGLDWLNNLGHLAKYPEDGFGVASLRGQCYLKVVTRPVEVSLRQPILEEILSDFLKLGTSGTGIQLAQMVVQRIAQVQSVRMRHPDPDRIRSNSDGMDDIRTLVLHSGGERLAQVIMLYSALTKLRSHRNTVAKGVLFLDNPFGALTKDTFMEQVRAVAEIHRLQLIFTCSVKDAPAISDFDHFVGLRKRHMSGPQGEYQRVEARHLGRLEDLRSA